MGERRTNLGTEKSPIGVLIGTLLKELLISKKRTDIVLGKNIIVASSMLVTDVGDVMCWRQLKRCWSSISKFCHQNSSPTFTCHQHLCVTVTFRATYKIIFRFAELCGSRNIYFSSFYGTDSRKYKNQQARKEDYCSFCWIFCYFNCGDFYLTFLNLLRFDPSCPPDDSRDPI